MAAAGRVRQGVRVRPGAVAPSLDVDLDKTALGERRLDLVPLQPVVLRQVPDGRDPQRPSRQADQPPEALLVGRLGAEHLGRQRPFRQVVHATPAAALHADDLPDVEQPLHRDLHIRPVPPLHAALRPAELLRRKRPFVA